MRMNPHLWLRKKPLPRLVARVTVLVSRGHDGARQPSTRTRPIDSPDGSNDGSEEVVTSATERRLIRAGASASGR